MKKYKYIMLAFIVFLINAQTTSAACTQEELDTFKRIEDEYTVKYELDKSTKTYIIYFNKPQTKDYRYQIYAENEINCTILNDNTTKCTNFSAGDYSIEIVGNTTSCDDIVKEMTINLPEYNKFSEDPLCEGIEEFVLCDPSYNKEISYETFVSRVNTYKKTKEKKENSNQTDETTKADNSVYEKIIEYVKENIIQIVIVVSFVILLIITIVITASSIRKSRRLE